MPKPHRHSRRSTMAALLALVAATGIIAATPACAQEQSYSLTVRNGKFEPSTLAVKAGVKFRLTVTNAQPKPAEFESAELNREKVVPPGGSATLYVGPLAPGSYPFFDDFNQSNHGTIVAK